MNKRRQLVIFAGIVIILVAIAALFVRGMPLEIKNSNLVDPDVLNGLPKVSRSSADTERIGKGIFPPTNSWVSGMILQKEPNPVYPMPYSFKPTTSGFEMNLPKVTSTPTEINGTHTPSMIVSFGAQDFNLTHFDGIVARLQYTSDNTAVANVTIASGSPYVFYESLSDATINIAGVSNISERSSTYIRFEKDGNQYVVVTKNGATIKNEGSPTITTTKDSLVTFYALPPHSQDILRTNAGNALTSARVSYKNEADSTSTVIHYDTKDAKPTHFAAMNYHDVKSMQKDMTYDSIYGQMPVYTGTDFTLTAPTVAASNSLEVKNISQEQQRSLIRTLTEDVKSTKFTAKDSYFAGKQLARAANLLDLAHQLEQDTLANELEQKLTIAFADRLNNDYFYYDTKLKGVAANVAAFGSEDFNDHHFHYGYFIYAASILGRYDPEFISTHGDYINLLAADISNYDPTDKNFPLRRNFDPYASHSWAAGLAPFADGNNQESSSEAIQTWNAVALWGDLTKNKDLSGSGRWLLAQETATATKAWRKVDTSDNNLKNYTSPLTSLSFGGKRTYATFFSDEPNTKLAIQLLPLNPMMAVFEQDDANIAKQVNAATTNDNFNVALGDYILMYSALDDPARALKALAQQQNKFIDDGNSRTYMNAWVYSQLDS